MHGKHQCSVFEIMGPNLLDIIYHFDDCRYLIKTSLVKKIAKQLLIGLDYMHRICGIIHTDLKPENIMLSLKPQILKESIEQLKQYKKKPLSMKFLKKIKEATGKSALKNKKKKEKKKQKKQQQQQEKQNNQEEQQELEELKQEEPILQQEVNKAQTNNTQDNNITENSLKQTEVNQQQAPESTAQSQTPIITKDLNFADQKDTTEKKEKQEKDNDDNKSISEEELYSFKWKNHIIDLNDPDLGIKIVDFGNGCWVDKHFTDNIQTREYRSPEAILKMNYGANTDIWSFCCIIFELLTNDYLFKPHPGKNYKKNEDHLALMQELLGKLPKSFVLSSKIGREFFNKRGELIKIKNVKERQGGITELLIQEYEFGVKESIDIAQFLEKGLVYEPSKRASAQEMLQSQWLWSNDYSDESSYDSESEDEEQKSEDEKKQTEKEEEKQDEKEEEKQKDKKEQN